MTEEAALELYKARWKQLQSAPLPDNKIDYFWSNNYKYFDDILSLEDFTKAALEGPADDPIFKEIGAKFPTDQADISKIERGVRNISLNTLKRLADAMDMYVKIEFIPKENTSKNSD